MSENTSPANESAPAAQTAATNQDNASENKSSSVNEATGKESNSQESQPAKKELKQGVRDTRTNKTPENADQPKDDLKPSSNDEGENRSKEANQPQQNNPSNNRSRGRRGRKNIDSNPNQNPNPNQSLQSPIKLDVKAIAKKAWKIFLAEVGEEGLALIGDKEAKELTKRSFKLGEIFQEEEQRRIKLSKTDGYSVDDSENIAPQKVTQPVKKDIIKNKRPDKLEQKDSTPKVDKPLAEETPLNEASGDQPD